MGITLNPAPSIVSGSSLTINLSKTSDVVEYAVTFDGIPPVLAKYIAYDNLTPKNPFIATVEDGLGNVLLDGGFPKWYNSNCNSAWTTYASLNPSFKYLYDAITLISNKTKVQAGNKKILIIGDHIISDNYAIKSTAGNGFKNSIDKVCSIKGYTPTYLDCSDFDGVVLNPTYSYLDQFCCILFFSTSYTNIKKISDASIASLIAFRENGNGIFFITDHGDRDLTSITDAAGMDLNYSGFYRTANFIVTNFGCYFTGNYNRSPVNVGYLRSNYGDHILWQNLLDTDEIYAGGSESKVVVTSYPFFTGNSSKTITADGYLQVKILMKMTDGSTKIESYTYGKNVPEVINFSNKDNVSYTGDIYDNNLLHTFLKTHFLNFRIGYAGEVSGIIKWNNITIGTFTYSGTGMEVTKTFNSGKVNEIILEDSQDFTIQVLSPLSYTKNLKILFPKPNDKMRPNQVIAFANNYEFFNNESTSKIRNVNKLLNKKDLVLGQFDKRFKYFKIPEYFKTPGALSIPGNPTQTLSHEFTYVGTSTVQAIEWYNNNYYIATDKGLIYSSDYSVWDIVPLSDGLYIIGLCVYDNYMVATLLSGKILISKDNGTTWTLKTFSMGHLYTSYIENISGIDYLYLGSQSGELLKYNLTTSTIVYQLNTVNSSYINSIIRYNNTIVITGFNCLAYITDTNTVIKTDLAALNGSVTYEMYQDLCITPSGLYCISANNIYKSIDGKTWSVVTTDTKLHNKSKTCMLYNPSRDEFIISYENDVYFAITKDFINVNYVENYSNALNNNGVVDLVWEETYQRYIILSRLFKILNYVV